jgi:hypothetical protein
MDLVICFMNFPEEASHVFGKLSQAYIVAAEDHSASPFYYVLELLYLYGEAVFLILILALVWCFRNNSRITIFVAACLGTYYLQSHFHLQRPNASRIC